MTTKHYLAWRVSLGPLGEDYHLTLKYLGNAPVTALDLQNLLSSHFDNPFCACPVLPVTSRRWIPESWDTGKRTVYVLRISPFPNELIAMRETLSDLCPESYPEWKPHITVPKSIWDTVVANNIQLGDAVESVGPLKLYASSDVADVSKGKRIRNIAGYLSVKIGGRSELDTREIRLVAEDLLTDLLEETENPTEKDYAEVTEQVERVLLGETII